MGDAEYLHAFMKIVMPIAIEFAPELVISTSLDMFSYYCCAYQAMCGLSFGRIRRRRWRRAWRMPCYSGRLRSYDIYVVYPCGWEARCGPRGMRHCIANRRSHARRLHTYLWFLSFNAGRLQCRVDFRVLTCGYQSATWRRPS